jgi:hypothetical protein
MIAASGPKKTASTGIASSKPPMPPAGECSAGLEECCTPLTMK